MSETVNLAKQQRVQRGSAQACAEAHCGHGVGEMERLCLSVHERMASAAP